MSVSKIRNLFFNYLNEKTFRILESLELETSINCVKLRGKICKKEDLMTESTFYRHIKFLLDLNLISKTRDRLKGGRVFQIKDSGKELLKMINEIKVKIIEDIINESGLSLEECFKSQTRITKDQYRKLGYFQEGK